jgi:hypothetical protein
MLGIMIAMAPAKPVGNPAPARGPLEKKNLPAKVKPNLKGQLPASLSARGLGPVALSSGAYGGSSGPPQATEAAWLFAPGTKNVGWSVGRAPM